MIGSLALTHESARVSLVCPDFSIDLDQALLDDRSHLTSIQGILQPVTEENGEGETFTKFVGTRGGAGSLQSQIRYG